LHAFLVVTSGTQQGKRYGLRPISRIGRDLRFDIRPHDPEISRHHAVLTFKGVGFSIQDSGSTNGTFVNEQRVTEERDLQDGDVVRVGRTSMRFEHSTKSAA
jgi:pSer/pThr/pTyr-binding forkhead associated (FHA) protein